VTGEGVLIIEASRFRTRERNRQDARDRLVQWLEKAAVPVTPEGRPGRPGIEGAPAGGETASVAKRSGGVRKPVSPFRRLNDPSAAFHKSDPAGLECNRIYESAALVICGQGLHAILPPILPTVKITFGVGR